MEHGASASPVHEEKAATPAVAAQAGAFQSREKMQGQDIDILYQRIQRFQDKVEQEVSQLFLGLSHTHDPVLESLKFGFVDDARRAAAGRPGESLPPPPTAREGICGPCCRVTKSAKAEKESLHANSVVARNSPFMVARPGVRR